MRARGAPCEGEGGVFAGPMEGGHHRTHPKGLVSPAIGSKYGALCGARARAREGVGRRVQELESECMGHSERLEQLAQRASEAMNSAGVGSHDHRPAQRGADATVTAGFPQPDAAAQLRQLNEAQAASQARKP